MRNDVMRHGRENLWRRFTRCLFPSFVIAIMASMPLAAYADEACGPNAIEISRIDHGNSVEVKCRCAKGYQFQGGGCVPAKPKAPPKPTALCPGLQKQIQVAQVVASRATLAEDVYDLYSQPQRGFLAPWTAPAGYNLVSNKIQTLRQMFPGRTPAQIAGMLAPPDTAYRAAIYATDDGSTLIVAFQGTLPSSEGIRDWTDANVPNYFGFKSEYFQRAGELALALRQYADAKHLKLEMVGHSLGGALATYAGLKAGAKTTVFNAENVRQPGLPKDAAKQADRLVSDYVTTRDAMTSWEAKHPALGHEVVLSDFPGAPDGMIAHHRLAFVRKALAARLENLSKALSSNSCGQ